MRALLRRSLPWSLLLSAAIAGAPIAADEIRGHGVLLEPRISVGEDFQFGLRTGYGIHSWAGRHVALFMDGEVRPYGMSVTIPASPTFSYRYQETRWSVGPGVSGALDLWESYSLSAALGVTYSEAVFWGSNRKPEAGWIGWGELGFRYRWNKFAYWGMAFQVLPLPEIFPARVLLQLGFEFGNGMLP